MLVPAAVVVILMCYIPMSGIVLAFKAYNYHDGIFGSPWVGLENFRYFFSVGKGVDDDAEYGALQYRVFVRQYIFADRVRRAAQRAGGGNISNASRSR